MIDVLLALYNGEKYLNELLNSLENQTYKEWRLIAADDGSKDSTVEIIQDFAKKSGHEIELHINSNPTGSAKANFMNLINYAKSPYVMFCDQDDVWLDDKIEITLEKMIETEKIYGTETPVLINTDLKVVDSELNIIDESFSHYLDTDKNFTLREQLVLNKVAGCSIMFNKSLCEYIQRKKIDASKILMHDSWVMLIALCFGHVNVVDKSTILYRQHSSNSVGANDVRKFSYVIKRIFSRGDNAKQNMDHINDAKYFYETYRDELENNPDKNLIKNYSELANKSRNAYRLFCIKNKVLKTPFKRAIGQLIFAHN